MSSFAVLGILLLILSILNLFGLTFILKRNYRFATLLFDLLPYYPFLCIVGLLFTLTGFVFLGSELWLITILVPIMVVNTYYFSRTLEWRSNYDLSKYENFLQKLNEDKNIVVISFAEWLNNPKKISDKILILIRHDVDISLPRAIRMNKIEKNNGIKSCYLFRNNAERYSLKESSTIMKEFAKEGFEIGFHYETITNSLGNLDEAVKLFERELNQMREIADIRIIAAHGDKFRNSRLVNDELIDLETLDVVSAYKVGYDKYYSEAGGNFKFNRNGKFVTIWDELNSIFSEQKGQLLEILIHSDWWF